ncbi:Ubiquitin-like protein [Elasticomyces elasticus]|nr:Ubiquitin-like protein [Elasticomyces elasticus]
MASSSGTLSPPDTGLEAEDNAADMPLTMAASFVLDHLPKDAHKALETAGEIEHDKATNVSSTLYAFYVRRLACKTMKTCSATSTLSSRRA